MPDVPVEVRWRPFFLNSWVPREGISRDGHLTAKFGSVEAYKGIAGRVVQAANERAELSPRTGQAPAQHHRLPPFDPLGRQQGKAAEMKQRLVNISATAAISPMSTCWCRRRPYRPRCRGRAQAPRHRRGRRTDLGAGSFRQGHFRRADVCLRASTPYQARSRPSSSPARSVRCRPRSTLRRRSSQGREAALITSLSIPKTVASDSEWLVASACSLSRNACRISTLRSLLFRRLSISKAAA